MRVAPTITRFAEGRWAARAAPALIVLLAIAATVLAMQPYHLGLFIDDAPFFFRYAESLAAGHGYRFNPGEAPVWGASAPLWPLCLALLFKLGASMETAAVALGYLFMTSASAFLALTALRVAGFAAALWTIFFLATDFRYASGGLLGMETPLGFLLLALGLWSLRTPLRPILIGVIAGLSLIHKLDFAVFGVLLLAGVWLQGGRPPWRAGIIALAIGASWYLFAWWHFGSPLPNSFLTKLTNPNARLPATWFLNGALLQNGRLVLTVLALLAVPAMWSRKDILLSTVGLIAAFVVAYTLKPPTEQFAWYLAPVQPALCLLAGCAVGIALRDALSGPVPRTPARVALHAALMSVIGVGLWWVDQPTARGFIAFVRTIETDRRAAGLWLDAHAAPGAVVMTGYGNIAYYSRLPVIDYSYLNRRGPVQTGTEMLDQLRPEFMAHCAWNTRTTPRQAFLPPGYHLAAAFDSAQRSAGTDFYVVVLARDTPAMAGK